MPFNPDAFNVDWDVAREAALSGAPDAVVYRIACGPSGPDVWAPSFSWVSGINGQLLARVTETDDAGCTGELGIGLPSALNRGRLPREACGMSPMRTMSIGAGL